MSTRVAATSGERRAGKLLYGIFIAAAVINLGANFIAGMGAPLGADVPAPPALTGPLLWLIRLSKTLIVPSLAGFFALSARGHVLNIRRGAIYGALLFCWFGDVALMFDGLFIQGMGAFAIAHLFFIWAYSRGLQPGAVFKGGFVVFSMPVVIYGYTIYLTLYFSLPATQASMALPLAGYMVVLLSNGLTCLLRALLVKRASSSYILLGVVLFIQSDSLIAVTRYMNALPVENFVVMLTYILGLFLMVRGCLLDHGEPVWHPRGGAVE